MRHPGEKQPVTKQVAAALLVLVPAPVYAVHSGNGPARALCPSGPPSLGPSADDLLVERLTPWPDRGA